MRARATRNTQLSGLWANGQLALLCLVQAVGLALVIVASVGSGRTGHLSTQTNWVALAVTGIAVAATASAVWLTLGNRRLVQRRARVSTTAVRTFRQSALPGADHEIEPVATEAMSHYHRHDCQLVRGRNARPASTLAHTRANRTPCAVCRP